MYKSKSSRVRYLSHTCGSLSQTEPKVLVQMYKSMSDIVRCLSHTCRSLSLTESELSFICNHLSQNLDGHMMKLMGEVRTISECNSYVGQIIHAGFCQMMNGTMHRTRGTSCLLVVPAADAGQTWPWGGSSSSREAKR